MSKESKIATDIQKIVVEYFKRCKFDLDRIGRSEQVFHQLSLSDEFVTDFIDVIDKDALSYCLLQENTIYCFQDRLNWKILSKYQKFSEDFIRKMQHKVDWNFISSHQKLSESFIREFQNKLSFWSISNYQILSESFIIEFQNKVDWEAIARHQFLSDDFIREFIFNRSKSSSSYCIISELLSNRNISGVIVCDAESIIDEIEKDWEKDEDDLRDGDEN